MEMRRLIISDSLVVEEDPHYLQHELLHGIVRGDTHM